MLPHPLPHSLNLTNRSEERLIREIMAVDEVDWDEAHKQVRDGGSSPMRRWTMSSLRPFLHSLTCHPPPQTIVQNARYEKAGMGTDRRLQMRHVDVLCPGPCH